MFKTLLGLFVPHPDNNYKAKTLHVSSLSVFMLIIIFGQILLSFFTKSIPGVLGMSSTITAEEVIELTNKERVQNGLTELTLNDKLSQAAQMKAADMIAKNYWAHTSPEGKNPWFFFKERNYTYLYAGENLARDFIDTPSVVSAWMNSPTHRDNILSSRYREIGIAVVNDTFQGQPTTLVVQLFGTQASALLPETRGSLGPAAEAVLAEIEVNQPLFNAFTLTKAVSISLTILILLAIVADAIFVTKHRIVRLSGKGLAHLIFLGILLILLVGIQPGLIL